MRALTIKRPWANLIVAGRKTIENRSWPPPGSIVGEVIAIHAGRAYVREAEGWMKKHRLGACPSDEDAPGGIIGFARVTGSIEKSRSLWFMGPIGWVLADIVALPEPIPCKGSLGLWTVPDDVERKIRKQIGIR